MVDPVSFGLQRKSGGLLKSSSKGNLAAMMAQGGAAQATPARSPSRSPAKSEGAQLLKRSRSMGTFGPYINFGQQAVEEISGKTSIGPVNGGSGAGAGTGAAAPAQAVGGSAIAPGAEDGSKGESKDLAQPRTSRADASAAQGAASSSHTHSRSPSPSSPRDSPRGSPSPEPPSTSTPELMDDNSLHHRPMARVDYFSHNWNESDLAGSWRYIVSRRQDMANSARLENASWRTWAKAKNNLKTIRPEEVNWLKDYDVTWLYGPLYHERQSTEWDAIEPEKETPAKAGKGSKGRMADSIKSILKKKTIAEIMMEDAPEYKGPADNYLRHHNYRQIHTGATNIAAVVNSQYTRQEHEEPTPEEDKHVHFNARVEQCISLDPEDAPPPSTSYISESDSESEEGGLFLGIQRSVGSSTSLSSSSSRTVAPLPATTLNMPDDEDHEGLEPRRLEMQSSASRNYDYNSVFTSAEPAFKIVDPKVHAVAVPSAVAKDLGATSGAPSPQVSAAASPQVSSPASPRGQPMASYGCNSK